MTCQWRTVVARTRRNRAQAPNELGQHSLVFKGFNDERVVIFRSDKVASLSSEEIQLGVERAINISYERNSVGSLIAGYASVVFGGMISYFMVLREHVHHENNSKSLGMSATTMDYVAMIMLAKVEVKYVLPFELDQLMKKKTNRDSYIKKEMDIADVWFSEWMFELLNGQLRFFEARNSVRKTPVNFGQEFLARRAYWLDRFIVSKFVLLSELYVLNKWHKMTSRSRKTDPEKMLLTVNSVMKGASYNRAQMLMGSEKFNHERTEKRPVQRRQSRERHNDIIEPEIASASGGNDDVTTTDSESLPELLEMRPSPLADIICIIGPSHRSGILPFRDISVDTNGITIDTNGITPPPVYSESDPRATEPLVIPSNTNVVNPTRSWADIVEERDIATETQVDPPVPRHMRQRSDFLNYDNHVGTTAHIAQTEMARLQVLNNLSYFEDTVSVSSSESENLENISEVFANDERSSNNIRYSRSPFLIPGSYVHVAPSVKEYMYDASFDVADIFYKGHDDQEKVLDTEAFERHLVNTMKTDGPLGSWAIDVYMNAIKCENVDKLPQHYKSAIVSIYSNTSVKYWSGNSMDIDDIILSFDFIAFQISRFIQHKTGNYTSNCMLPLNDVVTKSFKLSSRFEPVDLSVKSAPGFGDVHNLSVFKITSNDVTIGDIVTRMAACTKDFVKYALVDFTISLVTKLPCGKPSYNELLKVGFCNKVIRPISDKTLLLTTEQYYNRQMKGSASFLMVIAKSKSKVRKDALLLNKIARLVEGNSTSSGRVYVSNSTLLLKNVNEVAKLVMETYHDKDHMLVINLKRFFLTTPWFCESGDSVRISAVTEKISREDKDDFCLQEIVRAAMFRASERKSIETLEKLEIDDEVYLRNMRKSHSYTLDNSFD